MADVLCAGHICLDIIPELLGSLAYEPGKLLEVGPAAVSTGGSVSNTGLALHRLGATVELCAKLGDDALGRLVQDLAAREGAVSNFAVAPGAQTSYTVVLNPPGVDRTFLHCPGANTEFGAGDVTDSALANTRILHLGYPPLLKRLYQDPGEAQRLFKRAHTAGVITSLDMALPDAASESGRVDWRAWLTAVLPSCDLFTPSAIELAFMLGRSPGQASCADLESMAQEAINLGAKVVMVKNGAAGLYNRAASNINRPTFPPGWAGQSRHEQCFEVVAQGATGAGDAAVAGLLFGLLQGFPLPEAARIAAAVGACCVERPDALSGIPTWSELSERLQGSWKPLGGQASSLPR